MRHRKYYDLSEVGRNMRIIREQRHLSVEQVRRYLNLACSQSIYKWECGKSLPQSDTLIALCVFYRIDPLALFGESIEDEYHNTS